MGFKWPKLPVRMRKFVQMFLPEDWPVSYLLFQRSTTWLILSLFVLLSVGLRMFFFNSSVALSLRKRSMYLGLGLWVKYVARGQSETYAATQSQVLQSKGSICNRLETEEPAANFCCADLRWGWVKSQSPGGKHVSTREMTSASLLVL